MANFPWLDNYPQGVSQEINPDLYASLIELFDECFHKYASLVAFENMGVTLSYQRLDELSDIFAAYLQKSCQLHKGDRIAIQMPNLLQYPVVMFGAIKAGLIIVNTNPLYTAREMEHQFKDAGVKAVVILENFAHNLEKCLPQCPDIKHVVITRIGDMLGGVKGAVVNFVVKNVKKMVPAYSLPKAVAFKHAMQQGGHATFDRVEMAGEDVAFLQYTGGTTGVSKGAMLTHRNIVANMEQNCAWMKPALKEYEEIIITALPLYHIFALTVNCLTFLRIGARNVLVTNPKDMKAFLKDLNRHRFSVITGVNTLFNGLLNQPKFHELDFSQLKIAVGGGMAVQNVVAEKWKKATGTPLAEGYGLTETSPVLSCNPIDGTERIGTIGLPFPNTELGVFDEDGNQVPWGVTGEIWAKGPQIMPGYWNFPEETANVFQEGWFKTGDMGRMDDDGFFAIVDRKKEMINVSGFNVYPNEVEDVIAAHPKVLEVGVIGVPDSNSNEAVKACVVRKDDSLTVEELKAYCKEQMTAYKRPKYIEFRNELPKSNIGKILRRMLKEA